MIISSLKALDHRHWRENLAVPDSPFTDLEFILALEQANCIGDGSGWNPLYYIKGPYQRPEGVIVAFEKWHSYGEYIFDWDWAKAYQSHGIPYYPKVTVAIPFTPATVPKILGMSDPGELATEFIKAFESNTNQTGLHGLFLTDDESKTWLSHNLSLRHSLQFHWHNHGYENFLQFTQQMIGKKRRQIIRERNQFKESGLTTKVLTGKDLTPEFADWCFKFYSSTLNRKWGQPYLNRSFFETVFATMGDRIAFFVSLKNSVPVGGALCFYKGKKLFGRYWGATEEVRHMHFELCYYRPIEFAIQNKLTIFEAGAQGIHKLQRGFLPTVIKSAHRLRHPQFHAAIERYLQEEQRELALTMERLKESNPYGQ